jgi:enoyl-CoA hydratase/carnithine racemase
LCGLWDLKAVASLDQHRSVGQLDFPPDGGKPPRGPLDPSRLEMSKPVIGAVEGPAVAGGKELAMWCDVWVMAQSAYFGVCCRRWGVPLIDGGTVRLPRLVGQGKALKIILTGRKVTAEESYRIGLCEKVVAPGKARAAAEAMAQEMSRFPQACLRSDRLSVYRSFAKPARQGLKSEWATSAGILEAEGIRGARPVFPPAQGGTATLRTFERRRWRQSV